MEADEFRAMGGGGEEDLKEERVATLLSEYLDRFNAGEKLDERHIRAEHPDVADDLLVELRSLERLPSEVDWRLPVATLGDYTLCRKIGRGGMGVVYEAWQNSLDRRVALKVLPAGVAADTRSYTRFLREAQVTAQLNHPQIVPVHGFGVEADTPYYAMEYVDGETLSQVIRRQRGTRDTPPHGDQKEARPRTVFESDDFDLRYYTNVAHLFAEVAEGLNHAHSNGIIHRDVKPSNLILDGDGRLRILDFGLAQLEGQESLTISGDFFGTPLYVSPEQARRRRIAIDHRTDIYSLGATLYEVLTLRPPFKGRTPEDTLSQIVEKDPVELRKLNPRIPRPLETIVLKCMQKAAQDRYTTAEALSQDLRRFVRGDPIEARPPARWEVIARRAWRRKVHAAVAMVIVLLLLTTGLWLQSRYREARRERLALYDRLVLDSVLKLQLSRAETTRDVIPGEHDFDDPGEALAQLEEAVELIPGRPEASYHLARCLRSLGRTRAALEALDAIDDSTPPFVPGEALRVALLQDFGTVESPSPGLENSKIFQAWLTVHRSATRSRWDDLDAAYSVLLGQVKAGEGLHLGGPSEVHLGRGAARLGREDLDGALEDFAALSALRPTAFEPTLLCGKVYLLKGDGARAAGLFEQVHAGSKVPDKTANTIAGIHHAVGQHEKALSWLSRVKEESAIRERNRSDCLRHLGRLEEAEVAGRRSLELNSLDPRAHYQMALLRKAQGDTEGALESIRAALRVDPKRAYLRRAFSKLLWANGQAREALDAINEAISLDPTDARLHFDLGNMLFLRGALGKAVEEFEKARDLAPRDVNSNIGAAIALTSVSRLDEALTAYRQAMELGAKTILTCLESAKILLLQDKLEEASLMLEEALKMEPDSGDAHFLLGYVHFRQGRRDAAVAAYQRVLDADPENTGALKNIEGLKRQGKDLLADQTLEVYKQLMPGSPQAFASAGDFHAARGEMERALERWGEALSQCEELVAAESIEPELRERVRVVLEHLSGMVVPSDREDRRREYVERALEALTKLNEWEDANQQGGYSRQGRATTGEQGTS